MNFLIKKATGPKSERGPHAQCVLDLPRPGHNTEHAETMWPMASDADPRGVTPVRARRASPRMTQSVRLDAVHAGSPVAKRRRRAPRREPAL
jgi:hypothetical protein